MPGLAGLITTMPRLEAEMRLKQMIGCLMHEPFYSSGLWCDTELGVYVGWVAQENSFSDRMPVINETGDTILFFSGEDFPDPNRVQGLRGSGHRFSGNGCSYLAHLYEDDASFPAMLNGWFHGLVIDRAKQSVVLFNDRYNMHRVYHYQSHDAFYFAAEAKAILAVAPELREIDTKALSEFIACGAVLENRTLFRGIEALPNAAAWKFKRSRVEEKRTYFTASDWETEQQDEEAFYLGIHSVLRGNLPRYFAGDQRIGLSLTGGLDTRMVVACRKPAPGSLPCYTFGSMLREPQDVVIARRIAEMSSQPFQVLVAGKEFLANFGDYAERAVYLTDGCADVSRAADLYLNQKARAIAPVRMTGNYGGEILRAVRIFKARMPSSGLFADELIPELESAASRFGSLPHRNPVAFAAFQLVPWMLYGTLAIERTQLTMRSPFLDNDLVQACFRAPARALANNDVTLRLIADEWRDLLEVPTDRGLAPRKGRLQNAFSRGIMQFLFKAEYAYDMGMPQWLARLNHMVAPLHMEGFFLGRHKPVHFRVWYRDALGEYLQDTLFDSRSMSRGYLERKGIESIVKEHVSGRQNHTNDLHKILTLELFNRVFLDGAPQPVLSQLQCQHAVV